MSDDSEVPAEVAAALEAVARGMKLRKCRKCGCMAAALEGAARAFAGAEEVGIRGLSRAVEDWQGQMEPLEYDCLGCKKCWGAEATRLLVERFGDLAAEARE